MIQNKFCYSAEKIIFTQFIFIFHFNFFYKVLKVGPAKEKGGGSSYA